MEVLIVVSIGLVLILAIISGIVASNKGRSGLGWCILTIIFPIAILFILIAPDVTSAEAVAQRSSPTNELTKTTRDPARDEATTARDEAAIMAVLRSIPDLDADQLSAQTSIPRERVSEICHRLTIQGRLKGSVGPAGRIINRIKGPSTNTLVQGAGPTNKLVDMKRDVAQDEATIMGVLRRIPDLGADQLSARTDIPRERVSEICSRLASRGRLTQRKGSAGRTVYQIKEPKDQAAVMLVLRRIPGFSPGLDDGQLSARTGIPRERVSAICQRLMSSGTLIRRIGPAGRIVNRIKEP